MISKADDKQSFPRLQRHAYVTGKRKRKPANPYTRFGSIWDLLAGPVKVLLGNLRREHGIGVSPSLLHTHILNQPEAENDQHGEWTTMLRTCRDLPGYKKFSRNHQPLARFLHRQHVKSRVFLRSGLDAISMERLVLQLQV